MAEVAMDTVRDVTWASGSCTLDHKLLGLWRSKAVREGSVSCVDVNKGENLVAMGNTRGTMSLFRYPSCDRGAFSHSYRCHGHVCNVVFSPRGDHVLTVGGQDSTMMQWKLV